MMIYGHTSTEDAIVDFDDATFTVDPGTTCLLCNLLYKSMGQAITDERKQEIRSLNSDYHHTLGENCGFRDPFYHQLDPFDMGMLKHETKPVEFEVLKSYADIEVTA